jgi:protein-disulfide isomerase
MSINFSTTPRTHAAMRRPLLLFALLALTFLLVACSGGEQPLTLRDREATRIAAATVAAADRDAAIGDRMQRLGDYCTQNPDRCISEGNADAPVVLYEISDFGCPACRAYSQTVTPRLRTNYIETGIVRMVKLVGAPLGNPTGEAAEAVLCAHAQGKGSDYYARIFDYQVSSRSPARADMVTAADQVGLDVSTFERCIDQRTWRSAVEATSALTRQLQIGSTPTSIVNGELVVGANYDAIAQAIESKR